MHSLRYEDRLYASPWAYVCLAKLQLRLLEAILLIVFLKRKGSILMLSSQQKNCLRFFLKHEVYKLDIVIYRGSLPYATFGSGENSHKQKLALGKYLPNAI